MRTLLAALALCFAFVGTHAGATPSPASQRPNILFIVADDLATRLGCYGDAAAITPNLDRLAREGVIFNRAYCQGVVCTPSRTSFMLGLNNRHAARNHFLRHPDTVTLGRWMREHGYQTYSIGKIDHRENFVDPKAWDIRVAGADAGSSPETEAKVGRRLRLDEDLGPQKRRVADVGLTEKPEALKDWATTERTLRFLDKERDPKKPFFAAVGFHTPHHPNDTTQAAWESHDSAMFKLEKTPKDATPLPPGALGQEPGLAVSETRQREAMRGYYAAVTMLDEQIGRLLEHLRVKGWIENTVVVFTSDHGYHLGWRGQWCKHSLSEQVLRVPLIVRHPQGAKGRKANGIVELLDLFPTFCDIAGIPAPKALDGRSFLPLVKDPSVPGKPGAFCQDAGSRTLRTVRWRYTERSDGSAELYDHATDGGEYYNVIANLDHVAVVKQLRVQMEAELGPRPQAASSKAEPSATSGPPPA
ncbi:MAG: sulfatase, partial [Verrucomicrobiota bacterium]